MIDQDETSRLVVAVARKDRDAFADLYRVSAPKLFGIVLRICRDRQLAEDALQDAFVSIWRKAGHFDSKRGAARPWLCTVARNCAIDALRRGARREQATPDAEVERLALATDINTARADFAELDALAHCLERLDEQQRDLVLLAYYEGRTREELSERFRAPVNTIKTWLRRGLAKLRLCLEE